MTDLNTSPAAQQKAAEYVKAHGAIANEQILARLQELFGADTFSDVQEPYGLLTATVTREKIHDIIDVLHGEEQLQLNFLTTMCGVHWPDNEGQELSVVYQLHSLVNNIRLRLKIFFPIQDPVVPTLTDVYATANWMEREAFDFYGIMFTGHPNLIRILNVEDMDYHPMRKEYPLEDGTREDKTDLFFGR